MLRQLDNLWRYGRLRTNSSTARRRKPKILRERPELEIGNVIDFVQAHHGKCGSDFFFVQEHMVPFEPDRNACLELLADHGYRFLLQDNDTLAYCDASQVSAGRSSNAASAA